MKEITVVGLMVIFAGLLYGGEAPTKKKGICLGNKAGDIRAVEKRIESLNVGWHYNWTPGWKGKRIKGVEFVPMFFGDNPWSLKGLGGLKVAKSKMEESPLLGYNEPDAKAQANMSVERALEMWPMLEKTNRRLGSPAAVHADNEWMKSFMKGAKEKGYRVDFVCVHWYGGRNGKKFIQKLEEIHKLYGKPIWITEFAIADWSATSRETNKHSPEDVLIFMKEVLPELEKLEYVERYAWFHAPPDGVKLGPSALFEKDGTLTELGKFYASFGDEERR